MTLKDNSLQIASYTFSIALHVIIVILFLLFYQQNDYSDELVEITFGEPGGGSGGYGNVAAEVKEVQPKPKTGELDENDPGISETEKVNDEETISDNNKPAETKSTSRNDQSSSAGSGNNPEGTGRGNGFGPGSGDGNGSGNGMGDGIGDGFSLNFGGRIRKIYNYEIPPYPSGIQKSIDIKLRFTILPDGTVGNIFPLVKADALLEKTAVNSLRKWRFEPLGTSERGIQTAIITFPFRVN